MKKLTVILMLSFAAPGVYAQESMQQVMETRAREMHRVICLSDKAQWKKFITENYSQTLIDRPMQSRLQKDDNAGTISEKKETDNNLDGKVNMLERLHNDFGDSKIVSIKPDGEKIVMELNSGDFSGTFNLKFSSTKPYLIESLGIQIERGNN
jgi:hypothetical protein